MRVSSLGDVLHNLPMVADILRHHPGRPDRLGGGRGLRQPGAPESARAQGDPVRAAALDARAWADTAVRAEMRGFFRDLRAEQYDYVFDTQGLIKTGIIMAAARVRPGGQKIGMANGTEDSGYEGVSRIFHSRSIPVALRTHAVARGREVAAAALGYAVDTPPDFGLPAPDPARAPGLDAGRRLRRVLPRDRARRQEVGGRRLDRARPARWRRCRCCCPGARRRRRKKPSAWPPRCRMRACCRSCR